MLKFLWHLLVVGFPKCEHDWEVIKTIKVTDVDSDYSAGVIYITRCAKCCKCKKEVIRY